MRRKRHFFFLCIRNAKENKTQNKHFEVKCQSTHTHTSTATSVMLWEQLISYITKARSCWDRNISSIHRRAPCVPLQVWTLCDPLPRLSARDQDTDTCRLVSYCACLRIVTAFGNTRCRIMRLPHSSTGSEELRQSSRLRLLTLSDRIFWKL